MSKTKSQNNALEDTKQARMVAAQFFVKGDRVRHKLNGKVGKFVSINLGFAIPEVWIEFDSDNECVVPVSCNPLDLELAHKDCREHQVFQKPGMMEDTQLHRPELQFAEELAGGSSESNLKTGYQTMTAEVCEITATVDDASVTVAEVVEELTEEELADRHRLELKVDRGFYEMGCALRELKQRRLFRSTHRNWEDYCRERFQFGRDSADNKIKVAEVFENLEEKLPSNARQFLPTSERQVLPLTKLSPNEQRRAWQQAVEVADGKLPSGRIIKGIVERLKEKPLVKASDLCQVGQVFTLAGLVEKERKYNRCWAITIAVRDFTLEVEVHDGILTVRPDNLNPIDSFDAHRQLPVILKRIKRLRECDLDRAAYPILENLGRQTYLTDLEADLLTFLEQRYGVEI